MKLSQLNLDASLADLEKARDDIRTQVAKAYVQILYDMEICDVAQRQIAIDSDASSASSSPRLVTIFTATTMVNDNSSAGRKVVPPRRGVGAL